jgi:hypothetical protein
MNAAASANRRRCSAQAERLRDQPQKAIPAVSEKEACGASL